MEESVALFGIGRYRYDRMAKMAYITDHIKIMERNEKDGERMQKLSKDADKMMEETSLPPDKTQSDFDKIIEAFKKIFSN